MCRFGKRVPSAATAVTMVLAAMASLVWFWYARNPPRPRLVVLGIDGLDVRLLDDLVASGHAPNFARFYEDGAVGRVRSSDLGLPALSSTMWTTYVSGPSST
jgi:predicted AlkP superfamily pyrophosphatase or phosphodiesterase